MTRRAFIERAFTVFCVTAGVAASTGALEPQVEPEVYAATASGTVTQNPDGSYSVNFAWGPLPAEGGEEEGRRE